MLTKLKLAILVAAPLAGAATYAAAQDHEPRKKLIEKFDGNGDGTLDDTERAQMRAAFEARRAEHHKLALAKYDDNKDGTLDAAERKVMRDGKLTARFRAMDKDGDGALSLDEFKAGAPRHGFHRRGHAGHGGTQGTGTKP